MPLIDEIDALLHGAMRAKDDRTTQCLRMLKTKIAERRTSPGFQGEVTDAVVQEVAAAYARQLEKALAEYEAAGERGAAARADLRFEIDYLARFLPKKLDEAATREIVRAAIAAAGAKDPREAGKVVGAVLKTHRAVVDAAVAKRIAEELLAAK